MFRVPAFRDSPVSKEKSVALPVLKEKSKNFRGNFPALKLPPRSMVGGSDIAVYRHILVLPPPPKSCPPKNEKLPTAEKLPLYFGFTASAEVVTAKKRKTAYRQKIAAVCHYRSKSTATCDTAYKSIAMSEWSIGMALPFSVGIR